MSKTYTISYNEKNALFKIRDALSQSIKKCSLSNKQIVLICIGTDRSTGDSLGPLVGEKLKFLKRQGFALFGTLENPVHAKNLRQTLDNINILYQNPFVIAVDASLGTADEVGNIVIKNTPLFPGSALDKNLPPVGDISIKGIVNVSGTLDFMVLQNTRLYIVMLLSDIISGGVYHAIIQTLGSKRFVSNDNNSQIDSLLGN
ncbi:spore protease YyaC [Clostridium grantii]|uniref:Putative sporulation protein YyaC n=1 Tax=Clostridium grantii DSM 8605 TaxID=1121316 RepID=A0A1M5XGI3_9CLOT|nr:spore protease YyaC [Clostridium grantii]SHH98995.1 putative sporulation protein YyaC [Clostridium grantii DSM 8605]